MNSQNYIETAFMALSYAPGPFWLALLFCPMHPLAMNAMDVFLFLLTFHFTLLTIPAVPELLPIIASPTFPSIYGFIATPTGVLGSWNHMIIADLWIGRWVAQDSLRHSRAFFIRLVFIPVILFFGPLGLCFYLVFRATILKALWFGAPNGSQP